MLITFEGIDGSGKTLQSKKLHAYLAEQGIKAHLFAEPSDGWVGKRIKRLMATNVFAKWHPYAVACLFMADRINQYQQVIKPLLEADEVVILDRYIDSTLAYQGAAMLIDSTRGVDFSFDIDHEVRAMAEWVFPLAKSVLARPDLTFFIRLNPKRRMFRLKKRGGKAQFYERRGAVFYWLVNSIYSYLAKNLSKRIAVIDGDRLPDTQAEEIKAIWQKVRPQS